jgi:hypothetical protein
VLAAEKRDDLRVGATAGCSAATWAIDRREKGWLVSRRSGRLMGCVVGYTLGCTVGCPLGWPVYRIYCKGIFKALRSEHGI